MKRHPKIKVMSTTRQEWDTVVCHARKLGAISRDNQYGFNPDKPSMIVDNNYIKYSSPTMKTKEGIEEPTKISVGEFLKLSSLHNAKLIGADCSGIAIATAEAAVTAIIDTTPALGNHMVPTNCTVLTQNDVIFKSQGIPALMALGVEVTMVEGVPYIIDVTKNTADPLTTQTVAEKAKAAILKDDTANPFAIYANQFELVTEVTYSKVLDSDGDDA